MNRKNASRILLRDQSRLHDTTDQQGMEIVVSPYWVVPRAWFDERTLAIALLDADDIEWRNREQFLDTYMNLTPDHAEVAWPESRLTVITDVNPAPLYLYSVRNQISTVRSDWFDAIDAMSAPFCEALYVWSKGYVQPLVFADPDEYVMAVLMCVTPSDQIAQHLTDFAAGAS